MLPHSCFKLIYRIAISAPLSIMKLKIEQVGATTWLGQSQHWVDTIFFVSKLTMYERSVWEVRGTGPKNDISMFSQSLAPDQKGRSINYEILLTTEIFQQMKYIQTP